MPKSVLGLMHDFQKSKNITKQCMTNTQYFYDCIKRNCPEANIRAAVVIHVAGIKLTIHMGVLLETEWCDPSYETFSVVGATYFENIKDFRKAEHAAGHILDPRDIEWIIAEFIKLARHAESINHGKLVLADRAYYDEQADYVENMFEQVG